MHISIDIDPTESLDGGPSSHPAPSAYRREFNMGYKRGYELAYAHGYDLGITHGRDEALDEVRKGEIDPFADDTGMVML